VNSYLLAIGIRKVERSKSEPVGETKSQAASSPSQ
jgi:hypothetical protein